MKTERITFVTTGHSVWIELRWPEDDLDVETLRGFGPIVGITDVAASAEVSAAGSTFRSRCSVSQSLLRTQQPNLAPHEIPQRPSGLRTRRILLIVLIGSKPPHR